MNTTPLLNDDSLMPSGTYQGRKMADVPDDYLLWLYDNNKCSAAVRWYIERNLDAIKASLRQKELDKKNINTYNCR
ncbi:MAG: DUF3820 family protein [Prevotella sp.]|jgi:hypothetical protein|nr:DUF3820 family protein [Prevotella sp.]